MNCIGTTVAQLVGTDSLVDLPTSAVDLRFIRKSEIELRKSLRRNVPNPKDIANGLAVNDTETSGAGKRSLAKTVGMEIAKCFVSSK